MPIENTLLLKVGGGLIAAGSTTAIGVVYKNDIYEWFAKKEKAYFFVTSQTGTKTNDVGDLYDATTKEKNYKCEFNKKEYECEILKKIDKNADTSKKWTNLSTDFSAATLDKNLTKSSFDTADELFLLQINTTDEIEIDGTKNFDVFEKKEKSKKFTQLKPIFGKKNNELIGKVNLFLAQIKSFGENNSPEDLTLPADAAKKYKCGFGSEKTNLKECEIHKFTTDTQSSLNSYDTLKFTGKLAEKVTSSDTLKKQEYYLIKFTNDLKTSDYSDKDLIYFETTEGTDENTKKIINFSSPLNAFLLTPTASSTDNNNLLIINNKATATTVA